MNEDEQHDAEWSKELAAKKAEYDREREGKPAGKGHLELISRIDCLKNNWYVWSCELDGVPGYIQADWHGMLVAHETFEGE